MDYNLKQTLGGSGERFQKKKIISPFTAGDKMYKKRIINTSIRGKPILPKAPKAFCPSRVDDDNLIVCIYTPPAVNPTPTIITTATTTTIQYTTLLLYELNLHTRSLCILKANSRVIYIKFRILLCLRNSRTSVCVSARSTYTVLQQITDAAAYKLQAK
jgi:hypothetical protein